MASNQRDRFFTEHSAFAPIPDPLEEHYENWVFKFRNHLFPDHHCYRYKPLMTTDWTSGVKPDLVLIDKDYSEWVLVEVEKFSHSWSSHVSPQLEKFRSAKIGITEVQKLSNTAVELNYERLKTLMLTEDPRILVVCNGKPAWSDYFLSSDAELMIVRPLRNENLDLVLYADRVFQRRKYDKLSFLEPPLESELIRWYRITSPNRFEIGEGRYLVDFDNGTYSCDIKRMAGIWYFVPPPSMFVKPSRGSHISITRFSLNSMTVEGNVEEI